MSTSNGKSVAHSDITAAVRRLETAVKEWRASGNPTVRWRGVDRPAVSECIMQSAVQLFELVNTCAVEPVSRPLVLAIDDFDDSFTAWAEQCGANQEKVDPAGTSDVWNAYNAMIESMKPRHFPRPEPIPALLAQKVSYRNIAKIYGWYDEAGSPDATKVQEEITAPGTHYNSKTFRPPAQRRYEADIAKRWEARHSRLNKQRAFQEAMPDTKSEWKPPPESIEDLLRAGVNVQQVAKMHRRSVAEIHDLADEMGIPLTGNAVGSAFLKLSNREAEEREIDNRAEEMRLAALNTHPELGQDATARIAAMAADNVRRKDIAAALARAFPGLTSQQVRRALERKEPAGA